MNCPRCNVAMSVVETRKPEEDDADRRVRRYRLCPSCKQRYPTLETLDFASAQVAKLNGKPETFDRRKILKSIRKASISAIPARELADLVDRIVERLILDAPVSSQAVGGPDPIPSPAIGQSVLDVLAEEPHHRVVEARYALLFRPGGFQDRAGFLEWMRTRGLLKPEGSVARADVSAGRTEPAWVLKRSDAVEPFDARKLAESLRKAVVGRPADPEAIRRDEAFGVRLASLVIDQLEGQLIVTSGQLATEVMRMFRSPEVLAHMTSGERELAYLRAASTAKKFTDVESFAAESAVRFHSGPAPQAQDPAIPLIPQLSLRAFVAVADLKSFKAAAVYLNLDASTVSRLVRRLESMLGLALIERSTRKVELTADGLRMLPLAVTALQGFDALTGSAAEPSPAKMPEAKR
jgi:transcriptional regulator NrdR family protein